MSDKPAVRIVELRTENVKRLKAARIVPDPETGTVVVSGANGAGKTSVLDAIMYALAGKRAQPDQPVRQGATGAYVELDLGEYTVKRTWLPHGKGQELTVTAKDGAPFKSPQAFLDDRVGALSFDPLAFARAAPKEQRDQLLDLAFTGADLPFIADPEAPEQMMDLDDIDKNRAAVFATRTDVGRQLKAAQTQVDGYPVPDPNLPERPTSAARIAEEIEAAHDAVRRYIAAETAAEAAQRNVDAIRQALSAAEVELTDAKIALAMAPAPMSEEAIEAMRALLVATDATNDAIRQRDEREKWIGARAHYDQEYRAMTERIAAYDQCKADALTAAAGRLPVPGIGFSDEGVTYNGVPLEQASAAEQLRISVAIGMKANDPEIRVMRITDGSLLDSASMKLIEELATEHEYQVWIERVDETGTVGFVIEDGEVRDAEPWPMNTTEPEQEAMCGQPSMTMPRQLCGRPPHPNTEPHGEWRDD